MSRLSQISLSISPFEHTPAKASKTPAPTGPKPSINPPGSSRDPHPNKSAHSSTATSLKATLTLDITSSHPQPSHVPSPPPISPVSQQPALTSTPHHCDTLTNMSIAIDRTSTTTHHGKEENPVVVTTVDSLVAPVSVEGSIVIPHIKKGVELGSGVVEQIAGTGGMTKVYQIWNSELETYRAVKLVNSTDVHSTASARFKTEAKICANIHHPNIINIHSIGSWFTIPYIEMDYIDGHTLTHYIEQYAPLPPSIIAAISLEIASALTHIHTTPFTLYGKTYKGIIHRDIKPSNIMIDSNGILKLMDFGIARPEEVGFHTESERSVVGTIQYFSPEQLNNDNIDFSTDIYALGAIVYEMLCGIKAFPDTVFTTLITKKSQNNYIPLASHSAQLNPSLSALAETALTTDRNARYHSSLQMQHSLNHIYSSLSPTPPQALLKNYVSNPMAFQSAHMQVMQEMQTMKNR